MKDIIEVVLFTSSEVSEALWKKVKRACFNLAFIIKRPISIQRVSIPGEGEGYTPFIKINDKIIPLKDDVNEAKLLLDLLDVIKGVKTRFISIASPQAIEIKAYA